MRHKLTTFIPYIYIQNIYSRTTTSMIYSIHTGSNTKAIPLPPPLTRTCCYNTLAAVFRTVDSIVYTKNTIILAIFASNAFVPPKNPEELPRRPSIISTGKLLCVHVCWTAVQAAPSVRPFHPLQQHWRAVFPVSPPKISHAAAGRRPWRPRDPGNDSERERERDREIAHKHFMQKVFSQR